MALPARGGLDAKHYTLVAMASTVIAAAVVTVFSVVLRPARISFSVTEARSNFTSEPPRLLFTLAAHKPSRRAAVLYQSIFVDVGNSSVPQTANWMSADVSAARLPLYQPRRSETEVKATVSLLGFEMAEAFTRNRTNHSFNVTVTAVARFKVGVAWTKFHEINFSCGNVDFFANESTRADCQLVAA